jgi:hypothetical protein
VAQSQTAAATKNNNNKSNNASQHAPVFLRPGSCCCCCCSSSSPSSSHYSLLLTSAHRVQPPKLNSAMTAAAPASRHPSPSPLSVVFACAFPSPSLSDGTAALRRQKETEEFLFASVALLKVALLTKLDILNSMLHPLIHPFLLPSSSNNSLAAAAVAAAH